MAENSNQGVTFTKQAAQRIAKVVRRVEGMPTTLSGRTKTLPFGSRMWVKLAAGTSVYPGPYSWIRVVPDARAQYGYTFDTDTIGTDSAYDPNQLLGFGATQVNDATNSIVQIELVGYKPDNDANDPGGAIFWVVAAPSSSQDGYLPPHDHRDNNINSGGFAFSVYHPGTALPQQPWAV